jgi:hypothetical protein
VKKLQYSPQRRKGAKTAKKILKKTIGFLCESLRLRAFAVRL